MTHFDRRNFLRLGLGVSGLAAVQGCQPGGSGSVPDKVTDANASSTDAAKSFELAELTIGELQAGMNSGKYTCRSMTQMYLDRIEALNKKGPRLYAVLETNPEAIAIADALTES
jgi:amidase